jgi:hypothetical protein
MAADIRGVVDQVIADPSSRTRDIGDSTGTRTRQTPSSPD